MPEYHPDYALQQGDGSIFSKSVKMLPETEKTWVLLENDYREVKDQLGNVKYKIKECVDDFPYTVEDSSGRKKTVRLREKRVVTYNPQLAKKQLFEIDRQVEKARGLKACQAKRAEYGDSAKYVVFSASDKKGNRTGGKVTAALNERKIEEDKKLAGYNMIVTSEIKMSPAEIYHAYYNLWRIEESFRIMKSQLYARPVYAQKEETITGHFLVCYLAVLLTRILQFKVLGNEFCSEDLYRFFKEFKVVKISDRRYINIRRKTPFISALAEKTGLPLTSYFLTSGQISSMLKHRF